MLTVIDASAAVTLLEQRPEKIQALSGIRTHDLCDRSQSCGFDSSVGRALQSCGFDSSVGRSTTALSHVALIAQLGEHCSHVALIAQLGDLRPLSVMWL